MSNLAERLWPGESALGRKVQTGFDPDVWVEVIGVADAVHLDSVHGEPSSVLYRPLAQVRARQGAHLLVRSSIPTAGGVGCSARRGS